MPMLSDVVRDGNLSPTDKRRELATLLSSKQTSEKDKANSLVCAALAGDNDVVQYLLDQGCDIDGKDGYGFTVLVRLAAGKFDPCPIACSRVQAWNAETVRTILKAHPDPHAFIGRYRRNCLDWAVFNGYLDLTDQILQYVADRLPHDELVEYVNHRSFRRQTPLHLAVNQGDIEMVKLLLRFKIGSESTHSGHQQAPGGAGSAHAVDVNATMADGSTALHLAVEASNLEMIKVILSQPKILANERNILCYTPLLKAKEMESEQMVDMLGPYALSIDGSTLAARACVLSEAAITDFYTSDVATGFAETHSVTVHDVLYGGATETAKVRTVQSQNVSTQPPKKQYMKFEFQWVDLPSNNAAWAEVFLTKWCVRQRSLRREPSSNPKKSNSNAQFYTESLATLFETQNVLKIHSRQLKPSCAFNDIGTSYGRIYMPYLRWQTDEMQQGLQHTIEKAKAHKQDKIDVSRLGRDDALLQGYNVRNSTQLHLRRTLDQYRYPAMSTKERDKDQVVYRYYRKRYQAVGHQRWEKPRIYMVDQLWLWTLPDAILTCMPEIGDGRGVREEVIYDMNVLGDQVSDQVELIALIFTRCLGLFDRHYPDNRELRFFEHFEWSLGDITEKANILLANFESDIAKVTRWLNKSTSTAGRTEKLSSSPDSSISEDPSDLSFVNRLINIADETQLHFECLDMDDELVSLSKVLDQQELIVNQFWENWNTVSFSYTPTQTSLAQKKRHFEILEHDQADIKRLRTSIVDVEKILSELLNMKPRYATAIEARFTRDQAEDTARQGQILMVFTIVTIIFLPLSFLATFFAINISEFPKDDNGQLGLDWVSKYTFGIGISISVLLVILAFAFGEIRTWKQRLALMLSRKSQAKGSAGNKYSPKASVANATAKSLPIPNSGRLNATFRQRPIRKGPKKDEESGDV